MESSPQGVQHPPRNADNKLGLHAESQLDLTRRPLNTFLSSASVCYSPLPFQIPATMNSSSFAAIGGRGLMGLAKDLLSRSEHVIASGGQRVPK